MTISRKDLESMLGVGEGALLRRAVGVLTYLCDSLVHVKNEEQLRRLMHAAQAGGTAFGKDPLNPHVERELEALQEAWESCQGDLHLVARKLSGRDGDILGSILRDALDAQEFYNRLNKK